MHACACSQHHVTPRTIKYTCATNPAHAVHTRARFPSSDNVAQVCAARTQTGFDPCRHPAARHTTFPQVQPRCMSTTCFRNTHRALHLCAAGRHSPSSCAHSCANEVACTRNGMQQVCSDEACICVVSTPAHETSHTCIPALAGPPPQALAQTATRCPHVPAVIKPCRDGPCGHDCIDLEKPSRGQAARPNHRTRPLRPT